MNFKGTLIALALLSLLVAEDADLAKRLSNPVSDLISLLFRSNLDVGVGPGDGSKWATNIQPVIPFRLNDEWNVTSRTIVPVTDQEIIALGGANDELGLGDIVQNFFFSPKTSDPIWGVGPVSLTPTAVNSLLGSEKWGGGPTAVQLTKIGVHPVQFSEETFDGSHERACA